MSDEETTVITGETIGISTSSPEILIPKRNVIFDSQLLSTLMSCARLHDFRFNLSLVSIHGKSPSLEMGSIVHVFLEYYYGAIIQGQFKSTALEIGLREAEKYAWSPEVVNTEPDDRKWALETCELYYDFYKSEHWVPLEVEVVKGHILYEDDEIRILWKAKMDLVTDTNQGIYPVDHKSMKQRRDTLSLNNQFIGQCILQKTRQMIVNKVGFQTSLEPKEKFTRHMMSYSLDRLNEWQNEILPYWAKRYLTYIETGYWPPNFTHCENKYGMCPMKGVCEADRAMREEELRQNFMVGEPWDIANVENE